MKRYLVLALFVAIPVVTHGQTHSDIDFAKLAATSIPATERFPGQPKELVAVRGTHAWKHWGSIYCLACSPDGKWIATAGDDQFIIIWDQSGKRIFTLPIAVSSISSLAFTPDGSKLLAGGEEPVIFVWDLRSSPPAVLPSIKPTQRSRSFPVGREAIDSIAFSPDGKRFACSIGRQTGVRISLWDSTAWPPRELPEMNGAFAPFAFDSTSKTLVTQAQSGSISVWDISSEAPTKKTDGKLPQPRNQMLCMAISPDGKSLVTCHADATAGRFVMPGDPTGDIILWDLSVSPPKMKAQFGDFKQDPMYFMINAAAFSSDSKRVAFASKRQDIELWDVSAAKPQRLHSLAGPVAQSGALAFSPDGKSLLSIGQSVLRWDLTGDKPRALHSAERSGLLPDHLFFDKYALHAGEYGKKIETITRHARDGEKKQWKLNLPEGIHLHPAAFSADGNKLAARLTNYNSNAPEEIKVWSLEGEAAVEKVTFIPATLPGKVQIVDKTTRQERFEDSDTPRPFRVWNLALSPDGKTVVVADLDGPLQIWDMSSSSPKRLGTVVGHSQKYVMGAVQLMRFSSDGRKLATFGSDHLLIVWEMPTGKKLYTTTFPGKPLKMIFSPDNNHLITQNPNQTNYILRLP